MLPAMGQLSVLIAALTASARLRALGGPPRCVLLCGDLALAPPPEGSEAPLEPTSPLCAHGRGADLASALSLAERALWTTVIHGVTYLSHEVPTPKALSARRGLSSLVHLDDLVTGLLLLRAHDRALDPDGVAGSGRWILGGDNISPRDLRALRGRLRGARGSVGLGEGEEVGRPLSSRRAVERLGYRWLSFGTQLPQSPPPIDTSRRAPF